jgi:hypothetical protein
VAKPMRPASQLQNKVPTMIEGTATIPNA